MAKPAPEMQSIADKLTKNEIPMAVKAVATTAVNDAVSAADPIFQLINKINPQNLAALGESSAKIFDSTGKAAGVIIDATGRLVMSTGEVIGSLVKGTTEIINTTGTLIGNISKEALQKLSEIGVKAMGEIGGVVDTVIKENSQTARALIKDATGVVNNVVDKGSNLVSIALKDHHQTTLQKDKEKFIKTIVIICAIVVVIIIIIIVIAVTQPKKMTNGSTVHFEPNYNPEQQSSFDEKCYKYYDKLMI
jgi:hypothetical protein